MRRADLCHEVRQRLERLPPPFDHHYGVVPAPPPETGLAIEGERADLAAAQKALGLVAALTGEMPDPWIISRVLARREAVESSSIEGTNSTLDELLTLEEGDGGAASATEATAQVREYATTLDLLIPDARTRGPGIFTRPLVRDIHVAVMRRDPLYQDPPGMLREGVVWIGGGRGDIAYSTYNPAPPGRVAACLDDNLAYMRCEGMQVTTQGLITRMAVAHAHFEAVHPFRDGNGRTGRLLLPLMMAADGEIPLYLSPYINAHKLAYHDALKAAQQRLEWHRIIGFMARAVTGTVDELLATRRALADLAAVWRGRRAFRKGSAALRALDVLPHYPVITIRRLSQLLTISFVAASRAVDQLADAAILTERTGYAQNRVFSAPEALKIINRPFAAMPRLPGEGEE